MPRLNRTIRDLGVLALKAIRTIQTRPCKRGAPGKLCANSLQLARARPPDPRRGLEAKQVGCSRPALNS
jgi:hypothetical protein